jgi:hypothetical protein
MTRRRPDCGALRVIEPASMLDGAEGNAGGMWVKILAAFEIALGKDRPPNVEPIERSC